MLKNSCAGNNSQSGQSREVITASLTGQKFSVK